MADFNAYPALGIQDNINQGTISDLNAAGLRTQNSLRSGLLPFQLQEAQRANALGQMQQQLAQQDFFKAQVAQAITDIDETDPDQAARQWDTNLQKAADAIQAAGGDPSFAKQYIGKYSPDRRKSLGTIYGGGSAGAAAPAGGVSSQRPPGGGGGLPDIGGGGFLPDQLTQMQQTAFGQNINPGGGLPSVNITGQQGYLQQMQAKLQHVTSELDRVLKSPNPEATWAEIQSQDPQAAAIGPYDKDKFIQMRDKLQAQQAQVADMSSQGGLGAPQARTPVEVKETSQGGFAGIDRTNPADPTVTQLAPPTFAPERGQPIISGYTDDGRTVYYDPVAKKESIGETPVATGRYRQGSPTAARGNTAAERFASDYERIHANDPQYENNPGKLREDAINFGRGFSKPPKDMTDAEIAIAAARAAFGDPRLEADYVRQFKEARDADRAKAATTSGPKKAPAKQLPNSPMPGPPPDAVNYLKAHPETRAKFDQKYQQYGPGLSRKYLGQ